MMSIPQQVIELIKQQPRTIHDLCNTIYGSADRGDINAMRSHIHRARLIAPIVSESIHDGAYVFGRPVVRYVYGASQKRFCTVCGAEGIYAQERCRACYFYHRRNGTDRPRHLWDKEHTCHNCGRPPRGSRQVRGLCINCYIYESKTGKPRPQHLWGIGEHGWCDCGWPAITVVDGMALCKSCTELEQSYRCDGGTVPSRSQSVKMVSRY